MAKIVLFDSITAINDGVKDDSPKIGTPVGVNTPEVGQEEGNAASNTANDGVKDDFPKIGTPVGVNTSVEVNLRPSSFVNIGKHLNDTPGPSSTQNPLQINDSNSNNYPNAGTTGIATNLFPNNDDPTDHHHIEPSSIGSVCNALWFGSIALILAFLYSESEDAFVIDGSVEEEPLALDEDSTSKLTYFLSRYGTHNINISGSSSASSQHQEELFDGLTDENGGSFWLVRFLPAILPVLSYGVFSCVRASFYKLPRSAVVRLFALQYRKNKSFSPHLLRLRQKGARRSFILWKRGVSLARRSSMRLLGMMGRRPR